ncbi:MAG: hypothetical protein JWO05_1505 [Gemmatimonadetes bacterium]|nr:hypothetical protein [Gemmatimonadota bacterium]
MNRSRTLALLVAFLAACTSDQLKKDATPPGNAPSPNAAGTSSTPSPIPVDSSTAAAPAPASAPVASVAEIPGDTGPIRVTMPAGRSKNDSISYVAAIKAGRRTVGKWPAGPAALAGAILPAKRIIAYYGNPLSKRMGVLGEYPVDEMLKKLDVEVGRWRQADPQTPVQPALHLIAVVAQGDAGRDGKWRTRMDSAMIEKVYGWAKSRNALLFVDVQVAQSTVADELPHLMKFLARPDVHLGLDPEFSMHYSREGLRPGKKIGTMMASDINYAVRALADLVEKNHLPPKILVVHRFTEKMVPDAENIRPDPRVQVVMDMDGWGQPWLKYDSFRDYIIAHPVQYAGFKLFYHNDTKTGTALLTPTELLRLQPKILYIQYQ